MIYSNLRTMLGDIVGYIRVTGIKDLYIADDPLKGRMGFCTTEDPEIHWEIFVSDLGQAPAELRQAFSSKAGRRAYVEAMLQAAEQDTITDLDYIQHLEEAYAKLIDSASRTETGGWKVEVPSGMGKQ